MASSEQTARAIREVLSRHEQELLRKASAGKSPRTLALIYRQYEGENGVEEALREIRRKIEARLTEPDPGDERPLDEVLLEVGGEALSSPAERLNGAGGAPEHVARTPPKASPPASSSGPSVEQTLAVAGSSPATANGGSRMQHDRKAKEDRAVEFVKSQGTASTMDIARGADIAKGSITVYLKRLCADGRLERVDGSFRAPTGAVSRPPAPQQPARTPSRAPAAPTRPPRRPVPAESVPEDGVRVWLDGLDREALATAIGGMRARLQAYEQFAEALDRVAGLVPTD